MSRPLEGQGALVTGAASGIGRAIAIALAAEGAAVALVDRTAAERTEEVAETIRRAGGRAGVHQADIADERQVLDLFRAVLARPGRLDILVNNAGILIEKPLLQTSSAEFDAVIGVNLRGTFLVGREGLRHMAKRGLGRVINIASELAYLGRARASVYCASKGAILSLTRSWAREFAPGILVNAIAPGPIDTPMLGPESTSPETLAEETRIPLGRLGRPEEVAAAAVFLAGPGSSFMTGQCLSPNGGAVMF